MFASTTAIVTGGASGLGRATVEYLVKHGARVVIADLNVQDGQELSKALNEGNKLDVARFVSVDVTKESSVKAALDVAESNGWTGVNCAVNCAGVAFAIRTLSRKGPHPLDIFEKTIAINSVGTFNVVRLASERISKQNVKEGELRGVIINTASVAAFEGQIGQVAYAASKGAVVSMTLPLARDLARLGIRVMCIAPGLFETPMLASLPEPARLALGATVPCPSRLGKPYEFAQLVGSIISNQMLNGECIRLDGAIRMQP